MIFISIICHASSDKKHVVIYKLFDFWLWIKIMRVKFASLTSGNQADGLSLAVGESVQKVIHVKTTYLYLHPPAKRNV